MTRRTSRQVSWRVSSTQADRSRSSPQPPARRAPTIPPCYDSDEFAAFRRAELVASVAELGVTDVRFLGLRDGECDVADDDAQIRAVLDVIDDVRPDAIVTFGPDGITGHPDHRTVSSWTTQAWNRTDRTAELLYAAMTKDFLARHAELHDRLGVFEEYGRKPASIVTSDVVLGCRLTPAELERKRRALARHASQTIGLADVVGEETYLRWWVDETFRSATVARRRPTSAADARTVGRCAMTASMIDAVEARPAATTRSLMLEGARDMTPMVIGVLPFAVAIGAAIGASNLARTDGLLSGPAILAGSAQLTSVEMLDAGTAPLVVIFSALMINARLLIYSASLAPWFAGHSRWSRLALAIRRHRSAPLHLRAALRAWRPRSAGSDVVLRRRCGLVGRCVRDGAGGHGRHRRERAGRARSRGRRTVGARRAARQVDGGSPLDHRGCGRVRGRRRGGRSADAHLDAGRRTRGDRRRRSERRTSWPGVVMNATAVILTVGLGTYLLRASMFVVLGGRTPPQWIEAPLAYVGPAGIAALVGAMLLTSNGHAGVGSTPAVVAAVAAFVLVRRTGNVMHAFAVGMPVFWALTVLGV